MLSKSRGQVLRVAAVMNMLFSIDNEKYEVKEEVSEESIKAAINLVQSACQQTAFVAGRGVLQEEVENPTQSGKVDVTNVSKLAKYCMLTFSYIRTPCASLVHGTPQQKGYIFLHVIMNHLL